jgi:hypothetical protein
MSCAIELMSALASSRTEPRFHRSTFTPASVCCTVSREGCKMEDADGITGAAATAGAGASLSVVCEDGAAAGACAAHKIAADENTATTKAVLGKRMEYVYL